MTVPAALSLVTLGVRDVRASTAFYVALGFPLSSASQDGVVSFFRTGGGLLGLYGVDDLADDATVQRAPVAGPDAPFRGVTLAANLDSREAVDAALAAALRAGAASVKAARATDWGGYHGYVADPDGHLWEFAHNPFWPLDERGLPQLPD